MDLYTSSQEEADAALTEILDRAGIDPERRVVNPEWGHIFRGSTMFFNCEEDIGDVKEFIVEALNDQSGFPEGSFGAVVVLRTTHPVDEDDWDALYERMLRATNKAVRGDTPCFACGDEGADRGSFPADPDTEYFTVSTRLTRGDDSEDR